jgi:hypothetical protein
MHIPTLMFLLISWCLLHVSNLPDGLYMQNVPYHNCIYTRLPEDEPSVSKHVEGTRKLKIDILM